MGRLLDLPAKDIKRLKAEQKDAKKSPLVKGGLDYIHAIQDGTINSCHWVRRAVARQQENLTLSGEVDAIGRPVYDRWCFDYVRAEKICRFLGLLPHIKGRKWAGTTIELELWQLFLLGTVFGWVDEDGMRRFKTAYIEVARKNGKSFISSGVGLYCLAADGEPGAEVYSAAITRDQAGIIFRDSQRIVQKTPGLRKRWGIETNAHSIYIAGNASSFKALSRDQGGNHDGLNVHCALIDEVHGHKDRGIWDVLDSATGARDQPLIWAVTTAGFDRSGIGYEQNKYSRDILDNVLEDDEYFGIVYTLDKDDDPFDENNWIKANPNLDVSAGSEDIRRTARKAAQVPSALNGFLTKRLCVWVNASVAWMDMQKWDDCADPNLSLEDFAEEKSVDALDLASKKDLAARIRIFKRQEADEKPHFYIFATFYLPELAIDESVNASYEGWVEEGYIIATDGNVTDYLMIRDDIVDDKRTVSEVAYDPFQATMLVNSLQVEGFEVTEYGNTVMNMSEPMKEFEAAVLEGRIHHTGNPVLSWCVANVVAKEDAKENIFPRKEKANNKIDGAVALIMGLGRHMNIEEEEAEETSIYEKRGVRTL